MKYKLTDISIKHNEKILYRIEALKDFGDVKSGDLGGFIENEKNLFQGGNCWLYNDAKAFDNAFVCGNAKICDEVEIYNDAKAFGNAFVCGNVKISENAFVCGNAVIDNCAIIRGACIIGGNAEVRGDSIIEGNAKIYGGVEIYDESIIGGCSTICGNVRVYRNANISGNIILSCGEIGNDADIKSSSDILHISLHQGVTFYKSSRGDILCRTGYYKTMNIFDYSDEIITNAKQEYRELNEKEKLLLESINFAKIYFKLNR